jgi:MFS family permease
MIFRFVAGMGIGGEYTAINSAIDELIPSHYRGRVDIAVNGTYWAGAMIGAAASIFLLDPDLFPVNIGWRVGLLIGPVLGLIIIYLRRTIPESPRWLMTHGREAEAEATVDDIEARVRAEGVHLEPVPESKALEVRPQPPVSYTQIAKVMLAKYRSRSFLGFSMMVTQAFLYNAIFFTYSLVLAHFYNIPADRIGFYFFPFAVGNLLGPILLGSAVRHRRPAQDDPRHLRDLRRPARDQRGALPQRRADRHHADRVLVRDLLLRLGGCVVGVPHR